MKSYLDHLPRQDVGLHSNPNDGGGLQAVAAAVDRLAEQQRARNLLALATAEHRGVDSELVTEARRIITGGALA